MYLSIKNIYFSLCSDPNRSTRLHRSNTTEYKEPSYEDYQVENIKWLSIQEFSVEAAGGKINEFIKVLKQEFLQEMCSRFI